MVAAEHDLSCSYRWPLCHPATGRQSRTRRDRDRVVDLADEPCVRVHAHDHFVLVPSGPCGTEPHQLNLLTLPVLTKFSCYCYFLPPRRRCRRHLLPGHVQPWLSLRTARHTLALLDNICCRPNSISQFKVE